LNNVLHGAPHTPGPRREAQGEAFVGLMRVAYICDGGVWAAGILISELRAPTTPDPHDEGSAVLARLGCSLAPADGLGVVRSRIELRDDPEAFS
jgi:hypothetical protein